MFKGKGVVHTKLWKKKIYILSERIRYVDTT